MSQLLPLLQKVKPDISAPPPEEAPWRDLGLDSLDLAELAARIEQQYRIEIPDPDWADIGNVLELTRYLEQRLVDEA